MFLGIANAISGLKSGGLSYIKDNLKLYLDFKSSRSDTLAFPSEGSTSFDGNDYIQLSAPFSHTNHSISVWANHSGINEVLFSAQDGSSDGIRLFIDDGNRLQYKVNGSDALVTTAYANQWVHFVCTYNGSTMRVYANGAEVKTSSVSESVDTTTNARIGATSFEAGGYFEGKLANLGLWSRVLSPEEVQSVMNKSYSQLGSVEKTSLVMWQSLDSVDTTGRMDTPAVGTGAITTSFPTNIYLNSHGTTEYTEVMANNGNLTTQGAWTIQDYGDDSAFADTGVYSEGALKAKNQIITKVAVNSTNASVLEAFIVGQLYKFEITYTRVDGQHAQSWYIGINESYGGINDLIFKEGYWNNDQGSASEKTITGYFIHQTGKNYLWIRVPSASIEIHIKTISIKKVTNNAGGGGISITNNNNHYSATLTQGATTTTSVYGGNAPILPRAIDIAESFADAIGNGSASFDGSTDYIEIADNPTLDINSAMTLSCWVKINSFDANKDGLVAKNDGGEQGYSIFIVQGSSSSSGAVAFCTINHNSDIATTSANALSTGIWYHVAGTWNGSYNKIYLNGILQDTTAETTSMVINDDTLEIGRNLIYNGYTLNGNMAGVGLWRGALSQAQIQSLMESTSYAKILADVKSTLGSNTFVSLDNFEAKSGGQVSVANNEVTLTIPTGGDSGMQIANLAGFGISSGLGYSDNDLAKISFEAKVVTNGSGVGNTVRFKDNQDNVITNTDITLTAEYQTFTNYYVLTTVSGYRIPMWYRNGNQNGTDVQKFRNFSIEKVTCDLVAYYPLDADSSNTVKTDDLVGGETLGSNFVDDHQESHYSHSGTTMDNITNGVKFTYVSNVQGGYVYLKGASILSGNLTNGNLYKATFNAYYEGGSSGVSVSIYQGSGSDVFGDVLTTSNAEYSIYFIPSSAHGFIRLQNFASSNIVYFTNLEIQEVTSNTGVLK